MDNPYSAIVKHTVRQLAVSSSKDDLPKSLIQAVRGVPLLSCEKKDASIIV